MKYYTRTRRQASSKARTLKHIGTKGVQVQPSKANPPYKYVVAYRKK